MPGAHATYAPSSSDRWIECTASATAVAALGEQEEGEEAAKGTRAHDEIDRLLGHMNGLKWSERNAMPVQNPAHPSAYGIALFVDYVSRLGEGRVWVEQTVRLTDQIWGRLDFAHYNEALQVLTIVDYKDGYVGVDADASQFRVYAAAAILTFQLRVKWIRYAVVQPNDFRPVPRVKQDVESAEALHIWASKVAAIPDGPKIFKAGKNCTYCPLFGKCEPTQDVLSQLSTALAYPAKQIPADKWAIFKALEKPIADWFKAGDKAQTQEALQGRVPPGMKLVTGTKHRDWKPGVTDALRETIFDLHGLQAFDVPSPAQAEKLGGIDVEALSERPEGGPVLAFESDARKPWARKSAAEMFAGLDAMMATAAGGGK